MTSQLFAEVIVDLATNKLDKVFHYEVPSALQGRLKAGMRVLVPFSSRTVEGFVMGFCETPEVSQVKPIINVVEAVPVLGPDLMALVEWMADRYLCSRVDALHAMMPAKAKAGYKYIVPRSSTDLFTDHVINALNSIESELYKYITDHGITLFDEVRSVFGDKKCSQALKKLKELNLVKISSNIRPDLRPLTIRTVAINPELKDCGSVLVSLERKAPKQALVLKQILEKGPVPVQDLSSLTGAASSIVNQLVKKGYVEQSQTEVTRDSHGAHLYPVSQPLKPNLEQGNALGEILAALDFKLQKTFLVHGVTGSGKTEVYLQAIAHCIKKGKEAIVLVPEISLTPQMVERFKGRFGDLVAVLHSRLSAGERYDQWRQIRDGRVKVVVGARSAIFAPFDNLGLIVLDEEHETSYKQEESPKYHAREVAIARARFTKCVVVLGSATPSLESYSRAVAGKYRLLTLHERVNKRPLPPVNIIDLREEMHAGHRSIFSRLLIEKLRQVLDNGEQAILFLNRRGYSTFIVCRECGLVMNCPKCSIALTYHAGGSTLRCHYCDFQRKLPEVCPKCGSKSIRHFGIGTQKVEEEAAKWFPEARVARMDVDTTSKKGSHEKILNEFKRGKIDILVGTQMIAKGLDFPGVTLVGVITADTALNLPDFRAAERTFQLLTQVAGRAGRGELGGAVYVQTYNPDHYSIINAQKHDFPSFYKEEMRLRAELDYPPYSSLLRILIYGTEENSVIRGSEFLADSLRRAISGQVFGVEQPLLGPAPAPISKLRNRYRWQICVRGKLGKLMRDTVKETVKNVLEDPLMVNLGCGIDVDPLSMM